MQAERERRDDAEVGAGATDRPEEIRVLGLAGAANRAVGRHDLDLEQVVDRPPEAAGQIAETAAQSQSGDPHLGDEPERRREAVELGLAIHVAEKAPGLGCRGSRLGVDDHAAEPGHVECQTGVGECGAADVVAAAADREREPLVASEVHRCHDVGGAGRLDDQRRRLVDHAVPEERRLLEALVARQQHRAAQALAERIDGLFDQRGRRHSGSSEDGMFWLSLKRLAGSYFCLSSASRS